MKKGNEFSISKRIAELKTIGKRLTTIYPDKGFVREITTNINTEEEITLLNSILERSPEIVASEVYDALIQIKDGGFEKDFTVARYRKRDYIKEPSQNRMFNLLDQLEKDGVICLERWSLTDKEEEAFERASIGDTLYIDTKREPFFHITSDKQKALIPIYSSNLEVFYKRRRMFAISKVPLLYIVRLAEAVRKTLGIEPVVLLDFDSDDWVKITEESIKLWKQEKDSYQRQDRNIHQSSK